jgi:hypothetical protein
MASSIDRLRSLLLICAAVLIGFPAFINAAVLCRTFGRT